MAALDWFRQKLFCSSEAYSKSPDAEESSPNNQKDSSQSEKELLEVNPESIIRFPYKRILRYQKE